MRIGLAPLTVGRPSPSVAVDAAAAAGFEHVGLTLHPPGGPLSAACSDRRVQHGLRRRLDDAGITALDVGMVVLEPSLPAEQVDRLVDAAAELGARHLLVMNQDADAERTADRFAAVSARAGVAGLRALVEFMPYTATRTLEEAHALTRSAPGRAGIVLDVLHFFRSGGTTAAVARLAPHAVGLVQLCDARMTPPPADLLRAEALSDREYPGCGELPLRALLEALAGPVPLTVEAPVARYADRSPEERARLAASAVRRFLRASAYPVEGTD